MLCYITYKITYAVLDVEILTNSRRRGKIKDGDIMNLLKHISVKGEIFCEYAFLNFDFEFEHDMTDRISTEYIFRLPFEALVSSVKILSDKKLITAKSTTVSHASRVMDLSMPCAQIRKIDKSTYSMNLSGISKGSCHILITAYAELKDTFGKKRLNIPLCAECDADIEINMNEKAHCVSLTHDIEVDENIIRATVKADRDFCVEFSNFERKNSAIAAGDMFGGSMLVRVYPRAILKRKFKKALFVYYPDLFGGISRCAKEFILYAAEQFEEFTLVSPNGVLKGNDIDVLVNALSEIGYGGELNLDEIEIDADAMSILVSESPILTHRFVNVTIGDKEGEHHIFARDNIQKRAEEIIDSLSVMKNIEVSAPGADAELVTITDNSVTIFVSYRGNRPKSVIVGSEIIYLTNIPVYRSFAPLQLVCGNLYTKREEMRLLWAQPDEIPEIRKRLEQIGVKFSVLNSESALFATLSPAKVASIRVMMPPQIKKAYSAFDERCSMFEEVERIDKKELAEAALDIILRSMRADGAICADGEINNEIRKKQTLICLLALIYAGFDDKAYIKYAQNFLGDYRFSEIYFTKEPVLAKAFLDKFFEGKSAPARDFVPDLITSANIIRLFW